jgi:hypothetical protein
LSTTDPNTVGGDILKFGFDTVFNAGAGTEQKNQHKNAPGHAKARQEGPQFILANRTVNFLQFVNVKQHQYLLF